MGYWVPKIEMLAVLWYCYAQYFNPHTIFYPVHMMMKMKVI